MIHGFIGMFPAIDKGRQTVGQASDALKSAFAVQVAA
jgi:hypothetical protein